MMDVKELYTAGVRHALDLLGLWTQHSGVRSLHVYSKHPSVIHACLWRLLDTVSLVHVDLPVEPTGLPSGLVQPQVTSNWSDAETIELTLFPFSLEDSDTPLTTPWVAGCFHNTYSYRKLLRPGTSSRSMGWLLGKLRREGYRLLKVVGIYPPGFLWYWVLSLSCGVNLSYWHFYFNQRAFEHISTQHNIEIMFSHLVAFHAKREFS